MKGVPEPCRPWHLQVRTKMSKSPGRVESEVLTSCLFFIVAKILVLAFLFLLDRGSVTTRVGRSDLRCWWTSLFFDFRLRHGCANADTSAVELD